MRSACIALTAAAASAQIFSGTWEQVIGSTGNLPTQSFGHAAWVPSYFVLLGNDTSAACANPSGCVDLWRYNVATNSWVNNYDYPNSAGGNNWPSNPTGYPAQPFVFTSGGLVLAMDELAPNTLFAIDSIAPNNAQWKTYTNFVNSIPISFATRWGQRFLSWGSSIFMFGGITTDGTNAFRQDMWALEVQNTIAGGQGSGWYNVAPPPGPSGLVGVNWPEGRVGPSWTGYTIGALLFGGVATNDGSPVWPACMRDVSATNPAPSQCIFHHHVWAFLPGTTDWFAGIAGGAQATPYDANKAWTRLPDVGFNGGPVPAGRTEHVAGNLGEHLYIYGGYTANGPVTATDALWAYSFVSMSWSNLGSSSNAPPVGSGISNTGAFLGAHFYMWVEQYQNTPSGGVAAGGQLWRWSPNWNFGGLPAPAGDAWSPQAQKIAQGHTAGIVIGILIGLANLYFLYLLVTNASIDIIPSSLPACSLPSMGGSGSSAKAPGYYAGLSADAGSSSAAKYEPPM